MTTQVSFGRPAQGYPIRTLRGYFERNDGFRKYVLEQVGEGRTAFRQDGARTDALDLPFFAREFEAIDKRIFEYKYGKLPFLELLPIIPGILPTDEQYTWRIFNRHGKARMGMPVAGLEVQNTSVGAEPEMRSNIHSMTAGFSYTVIELQKAAAVGRPIEAMKADMARRAITELQNYTALFGNTEFSMDGLFTLSGVQSYTPSEDVSHNTQWQGSTKTNLQIVNDVIGMIDQVYISTKQIEEVKVVGMPLSQLKFLDSQPFAPGAGYGGTHSLLSWIKERRPGIEFRSVLGLETAGVGGTSRVIGYNPREDLIGLVLPVLMEMYAPFYNGVGFSVALHARMGSVIARFPKSIVYMDNV